MFQEKIDKEAAIPLGNARHIEEDPSHAGVKTAAGLWSALIILALPLILLWLLARLVWEDIRALGRAFYIFYGGVAEELSRRS